MEKEWSWNSHYILDVDLNHLNGHEKEPKLIEQKSSSFDADNFLMQCVFYTLPTCHSLPTGGVAQMVERSLSMREVPGSIPGASTVLPSFLNIFKLAKKHCIVRESNPGRPRGRRAFYHWTNDATLSKLFLNTTQQNFGKCHRLKIFRGR